MARTAQPRVPIAELNNSPPIETSRNQLAAFFISLVSFSPFDARRAYP
jgi:hypothetical protein